MLSFLTLSTALLAALAHASPSVAEANIALEPRQTTGSTATRTCGAKPTNSQIYTLKNMKVRFSGKDPRDVTFNLEGGGKSLLCEPNSGILDQLEHAERFECKKDDDFEFAFFGRGINSIWLKHDRFAPFYHNLVGTAAVDLQCNGNDCTSRCDVYVPMLEEDPDD